MRTLQLVALQLGLGLAFAALGWRLAAGFGWHGEVAALVSGVVGQYAATFALSLLMEIGKRHDKDPPA